MNFRLSTITMSIAILLLVVFHACSAHAKDKHPQYCNVADSGVQSCSDKPVYDQTGTVAFSPYHADSEAHMVVNGQSFDAYCNTSGASISCTDSAGVVVVTNAKGKKYYGLPEAEMYFYKKQTLESPLQKLAFTGHTETFKYRVTVALSPMLRQPTPYFCVPNSTDETCYRIDPMLWLKP